MLDLFSLVVFSFISGAGTAFVFVMRHTCWDVLKEVKSSNKWLFGSMLISFVAPFIIMGITYHRTAGRISDTEIRHNTHAEVAHTTQCIAGINYIIIGEGAYKNITPKIDAATGDAELCDKKPTTTTEKK